MRTLSSTLLAAQKAAGRTPCVTLTASNKIAGVVRLDWTRLYAGTEDDCPHAVTMPGDGSLVRVRLTPAADSRKLYRQRVAGPGPGSDVSTWTYTNQYGCIAVAAASAGWEVSIFWINDSRELRRIKSTDYGANWGSPELIDYSPTTSVGGLAAAYKPNGDLAVFFTDLSTLYVKKYSGGSWQASSAWNNPPEAGGDLSSVAAVYDVDWDLIVSGKDSAGSFKLWSLVYGDGGDVAAGTWSALKELASAPSDGDFEYRGVFLDKPDVFRCFHTEKFSGDASYARPFRSQSIPGGSFVDNLWREPVPFDLSAENGMAMAHPPQEDYCWLSTPFGVWRALMTAVSLDLSAGVVSLVQETEPGRGSLIVELRNDDGRYAALPGPLSIGCQLEFSPGYVTSQGNETSAGQTFALEGYEHTSAPGKASLLLYAADGSSWLRNWRARRQFRWNRSADEMSVKQILEFVLARAGLKLEVVSQSSAITGDYPDFTVHAGDRGDSIVNDLLSRVPDGLFVEGNKARVVNPLSSDSSAYSYGSGHAIFEAAYRKQAWEFNRVQVEGFDPAAGGIVLADSFSWNEIDRLDDRLRRVQDRNIESAAGAEQRGAALLRQAEIASGGGAILVPVNCGQQLYDVIDITDSRAGLTAAKKRVTGMKLTYEPARGKYEHRIMLGAV